MKEKLYIDAGTIIINLFKSKNIQCLTLTDLLECVNYIYEQICADKKIYDDIILNINQDAIMQFVWFHNDVFDLIGNTIILHTLLPEKLTQEYRSNHIEQIIDNLEFKKKQKIKL